MLHEIALGIQGPSRPIGGRGGGLKTQGSWREHESSRPFQVHNDIHCCFFMSTLLLTVVSTNGLSIGCSAYYVPFRRGVWTQMRNAPVSQVRHKNVQTIPDNAVPS